MASTVFEACISNVGPFVKPSKVETLLSQANVAYRNVYRRRAKDAFVFVCFETREQLNAGLSKISELEYNNKKLNVKFSERSGVTQRHFKPRDEANSQPAAPAPRAAGSSDDVDINAVVAPWLDIPYESQLKQKQTSMETALRSVATSIRDHITRNFQTSGKRKRASGAADATFVTGLKPEAVAALPQWLLQAVDKHSGLICPVLPIVPSPTTRE
jgi:hypothetical protein